MGTGFLKKIVLKVNPKILKSTQHLNTFIFSKAGGSEFDKKVNAPSCNLLDFNNLKSWSTENFSKPLYLIPDNYKFTAHFEHLIIKY